MISTGYAICLILSCLVIIYMASRNYDRIDINYGTIILLIPVVILGYWLQTRAATPEAAEMTFCIIYLDSTLLLMVVFFSMLKSFNITVKPWMKITGYSFAMGHCLLVWQCFGTKLYYSSVSVIRVGRVYAAKVQPGPLKFIHTVYLVIITLLILSAIVGAFIRKGTYSRRILCNYAIVSVAGLGLYTLETVTDAEFSLLPFLYVGAEFLIAFDYDHIHMHDITCLISEEQKNHSTKGFFAIDCRKRFLSCNEKACEFFDFLRTQREDELLPESERLISDMIEEYEENGTLSRKFNVGDITCICEISDFSIRRDGRKQGYIFELRDATAEQKVLDVMEAYNTTLNAEIKEKTESISAIQQKIVVGMANIIENRDINTGGHVKRTSDVVTIIADEILKKGTLGLDREAANDIVRAAPMHDLGKVSIDSNILCKPGRFEPEEYEIMKTHSEKSGEMVKILLDGVEQEHFVKVAYNVARYHHERWDGKGYPEGLVGTMIPLEARIMAIADVYDALVSRRCYKDPIGFNEAREIMCEGMGTQFDPNLKALFLACVDKLETYYRNNVTV